MSTIKIGRFTIENFVSLGVYQISDVEVAQAKVNAEAFAKSLDDLGSLDGIEVVSEN